MVNISKINWLSKEAKEAAVTLSDGNFEIICFAHPFNQKVGDKVSFPLYALYSKEIYKLNDEENFSIEQIGTSFEYKLTTRVIDSNKSHVEIGRFIIELDMPLPNDIREGEYVSFICDRIDVY